MPAAEPKRFTPMSILLVEAQLPCSREAQVDLAIAEGGGLPPIHRWSPFLDLLGLQIPSESTRFGFRVQTAGASLSGMKLAGWGGVDVVNLAPLHPQVQWGPSRGP